MARCRGPVDRLIMMRKRGLGGPFFQNVGNGLCVKSVGAAYDVNGPLGDAAPRLTGGWTGNEFCATEVVNLASLATFLQSEGWTAAATPQKVTVNGTELLVAFLMGCDFSSVMPGGLRNDLVDGMKAQGFCL